MLQIFGDEAVGPGDATGDNRLITIPVPANAADVTKPIRELFWRGFGLSENIRCLFHYHEQD